jgi:hypothetical protein
VQLDPLQLGFNFAKELSTQLITLSTGLLALSVTFTKDILKTIPKEKERGLKAAWAVHLLSIVFGIWTLMALTGTLVPLQSRPPGTVIVLAGNVRGPAMGQVIAFFLGTLLLVYIYGSSSSKQTEEEYDVIIPEIAALPGELTKRKADRWELVAFSAKDDTHLIVLLKRLKS